MRVLAVAIFLFAQQAEIGQIQSWYEAGRYQEIVDQGQETANPLGTYLVASSFERLDRFDEARAVYQQLIARGAGDPWASIGRSANALVADGAAPGEQAVQEAFGGAQQAVDLLSGDPASGREAVTGSVAAIAQYQLGLVHAFREDYPGAAEAFEAARTHAPAFAYAYYLRRPGTLAPGAARPDGHRFRAFLAAGTRRARGETRGVADEERQRPSLTGVRGEAQSSTPS